MLAYPDGEVRYFTVRECARLQTFPDSYLLTGSWTESMRQLGNAVPVLLAQVVARGVHERLRRSSRIAANDNEMLRIASNDNEIHRVNGLRDVSEDDDSERRLTPASVAPTCAARRRLDHA